MENLKKAIADEDEAQIYQYVSELSKSADGEVRYDMVDLLYDLKYPWWESVLLSLIDDKEELVRVQVIETLEGKTSEKTCQALKKKLAHDTPLVRGYACVTYAINAELLDQKEEAISILKKRLRKERDSWLKLCIYYGLYWLGEKQYFDRIIKGLRNKNYRNRCLAVNILDDILDDKNLSVIKRKLRKQYERERTRAVCSSIERVLERIEEMEKDQH